VRRIEQRHERVDLAVAGIVARDAHRRRRRHHDRVLHAPGHHRLAAVAEGAVGELDLDRLDRAHQGDALADRVERLGVLRDPDVGQRIDDGADPDRVDADLGEQPLVADATARSTT
jgi:hypothetical protein